MLVVGCLLSVVCRLLSVVGWRLLVGDCWLAVVGLRLLVVWWEFWEVVVVFFGEK